MMEAEKMLTAQSCNKSRWFLFPAAFLLLLLTIRAEFSMTPVLEQSTRVNAEQGTGELQRALPIDRNTTPFVVCRMPLRPLNM